MRTDLNANRFFGNNPYSQTPDEFAPIIVACGIKTPENIGHLIRVAGNTGAKKLLVVHTGNLLRTTKINRIAGAANSVVNYEFCPINEFASHIPADYELVALETAPMSQNLFKTALPKKMALLLGNESEGIPADILKQARHLVHIPATGKIKSLNVSHAAAICLFEWCKQHIL